jgi:hypothetical protein
VPTADSKRMGPPTEAALSYKGQDQRKRDESVCAGNRDAQVQTLHDGPPIAPVLALVQGT